MQNSDPCSVSLEHLSALADGELGPEDEAARAHVEACPRCRAEVASLAAVRDLLRRRTLVRPAPEGFWDVVRRRLDAHDRATGSVIGRLWTAFLQTVQGGWALRTARTGAIAVGALAVLLAVMWFVPGRRELAQPGPNVLQAVAVDFQQHMSRVDGRAFPFGSAAAARNAFVAVSGYPMQVATAPSQRLSFVGARVIGNERLTAVELTYALGPHRVSLYQVPNAGPLPVDVPTQPHGPRQYCLDSMGACNLVGWKERGVCYVLVSDLHHAVLLDIARQVEVLPPVGA